MADSCEGCLPGNLRKYEDGCDFKQGEITYPIMSWILSTCCAYADLNDS